MKAKPKRVRLLITIPPCLVTQMKERARAETEYAGGTLRQGGAGKVTVSDLVERFVAERLAEFRLQKIQKQYFTPIHPEVVEAIRQSLEEQPAA